jgi:hypothetical protein
MCLFAINKIFKPVAHIAKEQPAVAKIWQWQPNYDNL